MCKTIISGAKTTASDVSALSKVSKAGADALELLSEFYQIPSLNLLYFQLKCFRDLTKALKMIDHVKTWCCPEDEDNPNKKIPFWLDPETSWMKVLSKGFAAGRDICTFLKFLDLINLIDLQKGSEVIGKAPVVGISACVPLSVVKNGCDVISSALAILDDQRKIQRAGKTARIHRQRERKWRHHNELVKNIMVKGPDYKKDRTALEDFYESKIQLAEFKLKKLKFDQHCPEKASKKESFQSREFGDKRILNDVNKELQTLLKSSRNLAGETLRLENSFGAYQCEEDIEKWRDELWIFLDQVEEINKASKNLGIDETFAKNMREVIVVSLRLLDSSESQLYIFRKMRGQAKENLMTAQHGAQFKQISEQIELWSSLKSSVKTGSQESLVAAQKRSDKKIKAIEKKEKQNFQAKLSALSSIAIRLGKIAVAVFYLLGPLGIVPHITWLALSISVLTYLASFIKYLYFKNVKLQPV